jgi:hypothetical protein
MRGPGHSVRCRTCSRSRTVSRNSWPTAFCAGRTLGSHRRSADRADALKSAPTNCTKRAVWRAGPLPLSSHHGYTCGARLRAAGRFRSLSALSATSSVAPQAPLSQRSTRGRKRSTGGRKDRREEEKFAAWEKKITASQKLSSSLHHRLIECWSAGLRKPPQRVVNPQRFFTAECFFAGGYR